MSNSSATQRNNPAEKIVFIVIAIIIMLLQIGFCLFQIGSFFQSGQHGIVGAGEQVAIRNTIKHHILFPAPYYSGESKPPKHEIKTDSPPAMHLLNTLSVLIFGDNEIAVRIPSAFFSILSMLMLLILTAKHFSKKISLLASTIYLFLPINTVFCNMPNRFSACIFFSLLMFDGYLSWVKNGKTNRLIECLIGTTCCILFDWSGYVLATCMAISAFYKGFEPCRNGENRVRKELFLSLSVLIFIAITLKIYWIIIGKVSGSSNVLQIITAGGSTNTDIISTLKELNGKVIKTVFPASLKILSLLWLATIILNHALKKWKDEYLVPLNFFIAGIIKFFIFPSQSRYLFFWNQEFAPFVSIASACIINSIPESINAILKLFKFPSAHPVVKATIFYFLIIILFITYIPQSSKKFITGRRTGGSFDSEDQNALYRKILFAEKVISWTSPGYNILIHPSFQHRIEFDFRLKDRIIKTGSESYIEETKKSMLSRGGKVAIIGDFEKIDKTLVLQESKKHPFYIVDSNFFLDYGKNQGSLKVFMLTPYKSGFLWKFFVTPFNPPMRLQRNTIMEERLMNNLQ